jgi:hypothetical protein
MLNLIEGFLVACLPWLGDMMKEGLPEGQELSDVGELTHVLCFVRCHSCWLQHVVALWNFAL